MQTVDSISSRRSSKNPMSAVVGSKPHCGGVPAPCGVATANPSAVPRVLSAGVGSVDLGALGVAVQVQHERDRVGHLGGREERVPIDAAADQVDPTVLDSGRVLGRSGAGRRRHRFGRRRRRHDRWSASRWTSVGPARTSRHRCRSRSWCSALRGRTLSASSSSPHDAATSNRASRTTRSRRIRPKIPARGAPGQATTLVRSRSRARVDQGNGLQSRKAVGANPTGTSLRLLVSALPSGAGRRAARAAQHGRLPAARATTPQARFGVAGAARISAPASTASAAAPAATQVWAGPSVSSASRVPRPSTRSRTPSARSSGIPPGPVESPSQREPTVRGAIRSEAADRATDRGRLLGPSIVDPWDAVCQLRSVAPITDQCDTDRRTLAAASIDDQAPAAQARRAREAYAGSSALGRETCDARIPAAPGLEPGGWGIRNRAIRKGVPWKSPRP